jgi:hypothetical protein
LLFLRKRLRVVCLALDLLSQGIDLSQHQQAFLFKRGDLFFQRIAAALVIRQLKRLILLNGGMFAGTAQRTGFAGLKLGTIAFQIFNRCFTLAQGFQIQIVLVFSLYCWRRSVSVSLSLFCSAWPSARFHCSGAGAFAAADSGHAATSAAGAACVTWTAAPWPR